MDSLYSLVVWHATLLKTDHCALFVLRFSICAFVLRNVCTPNLALSEVGGTKAFEFKFKDVSH